MRILFFSPHPHLGLNDKAGYATHMRKVIQALRDQGNTVETFIAGGETESPLPGNTFPASRKGMLRKMMPLVVWESLKDLFLLRADKRIGKQLEEKIRLFKPDLVYERVNYFQLSGVKACKKYGIRHMAEINSPYTEERLVLQGPTFLMKIARRRERKLLRLTGNAVVVSTALKKYFSERYPFASGKILVVPNAVDPRQAVTDERYINRFLEEHPDLKQKRIIGFVGSIAPWHGIERLVKAAAVLCRQRNDLAFVVVGAGQQLSHFQDMARSLGLDRHFIWTGSLPSNQVFSLISLMDITVMPDSNWYGSPIKIFEYGLFKKPVIAPDYVPLQDVIENMKDGLLIPPGENELPQAIERLLDHPELAAGMGTSLHSKIISTFTWSHVAVKIIQAARS